MFRRSQVEWAISETIGMSVAPGGLAPERLRGDLKRLRDTDLKVGISNPNLDLDLRRYAFLPQGPVKQGVDTSYSEADAFSILIGYQLLDSGYPQGAVVRLMRQLGLRLSEWHEQPATAFHTEPYYLVLPKGAWATLDWVRSGSDRSKVANLCESQRLLEVLGILAKHGVPILLIELVLARRRLRENLHRAPLIKRGRART